MELVRIKTDDQLNRPSLNFKIMNKAFRITDHQNLSTLFFAINSAKFDMYVHIILNDMMIE
jgi:hypothetical protein